MKLKIADYIRKNFIEEEGTEPDYAKSLYSSLEYQCRMKHSKFDDVNHLAYVIGLLYNYEVKILKLNESGDELVSYWSNILATGDKTVLVVLIDDMEQCYPVFPLMS